MMEQLDIFGTQPGSHRRDGPATSIIAAHDPALVMRWGSQRHVLLEAFGLAAEEGLTDEEAGFKTGLYQKRAVYWARCAELRNAGFLEVTAKTRQSIQDQEVQVCRITTAGRQALMRAFQGRQSDA
jgi:hypothetical protein